MSAGRSSTGISPRPMLMGAPRNALRAFNAGVSLSCLCILAHRLLHLFRGLVLSLTCLVGVPSCGLATGSWRTGRPAPHRQIVSVCLMLPEGFLCQGGFSPRHRQLWGIGGTVRRRVRRLHPHQGEPAGYGTALTSWASRLTPTANWSPSMTDIRCQRIRKNFFAGLRAKSSCSRRQPERSRRPDLPDFLPPKSWKQNWMDLPPTRPLCKRNFAKYGGRKRNMTPSARMWTHCWKGLMSRIKNIDEST